MNNLFLPAFVLFRRVTLPSIHVLIGVLIVLTGAAGNIVTTFGYSAALAVLCTGLVALAALYLLAAVCVWTIVGMKRVGVLVERIASGNLTKRVVVESTD
jgi:hypothetical protein